MFRPNLDALIYPRTGHDLFGQETYSDPKPVRCAIVNLSLFVEQTTVRADSTATRGSADEEVVKSKILVPADTTVKSGDKFKVLGFTVEIISNMPRVDTQGNVDHRELMAKIKVDPSE